MSTRTRNTRTLSDIDEIYLNDIDCDEYIPSFINWIYSGENYLNNKDKLKSSLIKQDYFTEQFIESQFGERKAFDGDIETGQMIRLEDIKKDSSQPLAQALLFALNDGNKQNLAIAFCINNVQSSEYGIIRPRFVISASGINKEFDCIRNTDIKNKKVFFKANFDENYLNSTFLK